MKNTKYGIGKVGNKTLVVVEISRDMVNAGRALGRFAILERVPNKPGKVVRDGFPTRKDAIVSLEEMCAS
jgi:hypothetical protein